MNADKRHVPTVSVIVPAYNVASYLQGTLETLLSQTYPSIEIWVVDDGSVDNSVDIVMKIQETNPTLNLLRLEQNVGVTRARQAAFASCTGDWIWFIDADDSWPDDAIERMMAVITAEVDVVIAGAEYEYLDGRASRPIPPPHLSSGEANGQEAFELLLAGEIKGHLWNKLISRRTVESISFRPSRVHSDLSMVSEVLAHAQKVKALDYTVYRYRIRQGSLITTRTQRAESLATVREVVENAADMIDADLRNTTLFQYFLNRFIFLSALKDADSGAYDRTDSLKLATAARKDLSWRGVWGGVIQRDWKRSILMSCGKISPRLFRAIGRRV